MANISVLSRVIGNVTRNVDVSVNTLVVGGITIGAVNFTPTIAGNLLSLQNGSEVGATLHTHDTIYTRTTALASAAAGSAGSTLIGDNNSYTHFTPASSTLKAALSAIDTALGASTASTAFDGTFVILNTADNTKKIKHDASAISTGQTRTIFMPDSNVNLGLVATALQANGSVTATSALNMGGFKITGLATPTAGTDAVNKNYVDNKVSGLEWRPAVNLLDSVDTVLPATTATLIDGVTVTNGMRVLFTTLSSGNNEIYTAAVSGSAITWTLATDGITGTGVPGAGDAVLVLQGTNYSEAAYNYSGVSNTWVQFNGAGQIQAGSGLIKSGNTLSVLPAPGSAIAVSGSGVSVAVSTTGGIQVSSSALALLLADTSLLTSASGVKVNLATVSGLTVSSGLKVATDGISVGINGSNQVYIPNNGVQNSQINFNVFDQTTITGGNGLAATVVSAPSVIRSNLIAGQAFSANTTYAVRWGIPANGETAGRIYAADITTSSFDLFWVIGLFNSASSIAIAGTIPSIVERGELTLGSSDTVFSSTDQGKPCFLGASGAVAANSAAVTTSGSASTKLGIVKSASVIDVAPQVMGVY